MLIVYNKRIINIAIHINNNRINNTTHINACNSTNIHIYKHTLRHNNITRNIAGNRNRSSMTERTRNTFRMIIINNIVTTLQY